MTRSEQSECQRVGALPLDVPLGAEPAHFESPNRLDVTFRAEGQERRGHSLRHVPRQLIGVALGAPDQAAHGAEQLRNHMDDARSTLLRPIQQLLKSSPAWTEGSFPERLAAGRTAELVKVHSGIRPWRPLERAAV